MVLRREAIIERLKELDRILQELSKYESVAWEEFQTDLSQRWVVERGLIAAASIVAKVSRDRLMCRLAQDYPGYGFEQHMGYGVPVHLDALDRLGPTVHHRRLFAPVAAAWQKHFGGPVPNGVVEAVDEVADPDQASLPLVMSSVAVPA